jgi:hypothetical protein
MKMARTEWKTRSMLLWRKGQETRRPGYQMDCLHVEINKNYDRNSVGVTASQKLKLSRNEKE